MRKIYLLALTSILFIQSVQFSNAYTVDELDGANFMAGNSYIVNYSDSPEKYRLGDSITRREMMKVIANMGGEELNMVCEGKFSDVKTNDWGCKYIEWALGKGIVANNATFRPDAVISKSEALKMIFRVKNIEKTVNTGVWQKDYVETAYGNSWYEEKWTDYTTSATRGWIFMSANRIINNIKVGEVDDTQAIIDELFDLLQ